MNLLKKVSKFTIAGGILLVALAIYIYTVQKDEKENPANSFIGSDFSASKASVIPTATLTPIPTPTPTIKPLAKSDFRYIFNYGNSQKFFDIKAAKDQTVFSVLEGLAKEQNFEIKTKMYPMGILIQSIDGFAGGDEGKYWQYYINGALGQVAADKQALKAGDNLEWKFEKVPEY